MRILLLTQYYAPEPAFKFADLARGLVERGHTVQVITGFPCYPIGKTYAGYKQSLYSEEDCGGVLVTRVPQLPDHSRSIIRRVLYYASFAISAATIGWWRARRADVILVYQSAMPTGLTGWWLSLVKRTPYVLDVVDLWPESLHASGMLTNRNALAIVATTMRFIYRHARRVNVITEGYKGRLSESGVPEGKISLIHCWPTAGQFDPGPRDHELEKQHGLNGRFNIVYAGAMGSFQRLDTVLDAASQLSDVPDVQFVMIGDGVCQPELAERSRQLGLTNVLFLGRLPPQLLTRLYAAAEGLLVHLSPSEMARVSIPSKTFAYMCSGRPILMGCPGEASRLIERHRCGVCFTPNDPRSLARCVRRLWEMSDRERKELADNGRKAFLENFESSLQIDKYSHLLHDAAGRAFPSAKTAA